MAHDVHLHVCFPADKNDGVAELARKHLALLTYRKEAAWFLEDLAGRTGKNPGPKGGLSLWGMVGNYTNAESFVEVLKPFWTELLGVRCDGGPLGFEHIIVFYEHEQTLAANAYEIMLEDGELIVKHHQDLPFCWAQY